jgi:hypothetical protein
MSDATTRTRIFTALYPYEARAPKPILCKGCRKDTSRGCSVYHSREHACRTGECRERQC